MKSVITKTATIFVLATSFNATATDTISTVNIEAIKSTLTPEQIQPLLNNWKSQELANIESRAKNMTDKVPLEARRDIAKSQIDTEYKQAAKTLGL
ncbi:TPA: hypothetical protein NJ328_001261 [Vibrio parahaemolyticus]|nr:hypothetical protein [Vibrio parahaemolyticus]